MEPSDWFALGALIVATASLVVAIVSGVRGGRALKREQRDREEGIQLLRQQVLGQGAAVLVMEEPEVRTFGPDTVEVRFVVRNTGRGVARRISIQIVRPGGDVLASASVAVALIADERADVVSLDIPREEAERGGLLVVAAWEDDNGRHQKDVGPIPDELEGPSVIY